MSSSISKCDRSFAVIIPPRRRFWFVVICACLRDVVVCRLDHKIGYIIYSGFWDICIFYFISETLPVCSSKVVTFFSVKWCGVVADGDVDWSVV